MTEKHETGNRKTKIYAVIYGMSLVAFSAYVLLDTFVIERGYQHVQQENNSFYAELNTDETGDKDIGDFSFQDENISIEITTYYENNTTIYAADIQVSDIRYLKSAFAKSTYGKNVTDTTSSIAEECGAVLAINGDFYGAQNDGYVIRNGVLYRNEARSDEQEDFVIYTDGSCKVIREGDITAEELLEQGALQVYSFGPGIVTEGEISVTKDEEVGKAMASNPRTAIGVISPLHYVMVVADGRTRESEGMSLYELAEFMESLGVTEAYNLDGGGSSTMYFNGEVINNPTTNGKSIEERSVSDIVYIG